MIDLKKIKPIHWVMTLAGIITAMGTIFGAYMSWKSMSYDLFYREKVRQDAREVAREVCGRTSRRTRR